MGIGLIELAANGILSIGDYEKAYDSGYLRYESYINTGILTDLTPQILGGFSSYGFYMNLKRLDMPNIKTINGAIFNNMRGVTVEEINAPQVQTVTQETFAYCSNLKQLNLPRLSTLQSTYDVFKSCSALEELYLPNCEYIPASTFDGCPNVKTLDIRACKYLFSVPDNLSVLSLYGFSYIDDDNMWINNGNLILNIYNASYVNLEKSGDPYAIIRVSEIYLHNCIEFVCSSGSYSYAAKYISADYIYAPVLEHIDEGISITAHAVSFNKLSSIWSGLFNNISLSSIYAPNLKYLGENALKKSYILQNLSTINFPKLESIDGEAFYLFSSVNRDIMYYPISYNISQVLLPSIRELTFSRAHDLYIVDYCYYINQYGEIFGKVPSTKIDLKNVSHVTDMAYRTESERYMIENRQYYINANMNMPNLRQYTIDLYNVDWGLYSSTGETLYLSSNGIYLSNNLNAIANTPLSSLKEIQIIEPSNYSGPIQLSDRFLNGYLYYINFVASPFDYDSEYTYYNGINFNFSNLISLGNESVILNFYSLYPYTYDSVHYSSGEFLYPNIVGDINFSFPKLTNGSLYLTIDNQKNEFMSINSVYINPEFSGKIALAGVSSFTIPSYTDYAAIVANDITINALVIDLKEPIDSDPSYYYDGLQPHGYYLTYSNLYMPNLVSAIHGHGMFNFLSGNKVINRISAPNLEYIYHSDYSSFASNVNKRINELYLPKLSEIDTNLLDFTFYFYRWVTYYISSINVGLTSINHDGATFVSYYSYPEPANELKRLTLPQCSYLSTYAMMYQHLQSLSLPVCEYINISNTSMVSGQEVSHYYRNAKLSVLSLPMCTTLGNIDVFTRLTYISLPICTSIESYAMKGLSSLTYISLPVCEAIGYDALPNTLKVLRLSGYFSDNHGVSIERQHFLSGAVALQVPVSLYTYYRTNYYSSMFNVIYYSDFEPGEDIPYAYYINSDAHYMEDVAEGDDLLNPSTFTPTYSDYSFLGYATYSYSFSALSSKTADPLDVTRQEDILYAIFSKSSTCYIYDYLSSYSVSGIGYYNNGNVSSPMFTLNEVGYSDFTPIGWTSLPTVQDISRPTEYDNGGTYNILALPESVYAVYSKNTYGTYIFGPGCVYDGNRQQLQIGPYPRFSHASAGLIGYPISLMSLESIDTLYCNTSVYGSWFIEGSYYSAEDNYTLVQDNTSMYMQAIAEPYVISNGSLIYESEALPPGMGKSLQITNLDKLYSNSYYGALAFDTFDQKLYESLFSDIYDIVETTRFDTVNSIKNLNEYFNITGHTSWFMSKYCTLDLQFIGVPDNNTPIDYLIGKNAGFVITNGSYVYSSQYVVDSSHVSGNVVTYDIGSISFPLIDRRLYLGLNYQTRLRYIDTSTIANDVVYSLYIRNMKITNQDGTSILF